MMSYRNPLTRTKKQKAMALLQAQQLVEAKVQFEQVCKTDARDVEAWAALGSIHLTLGLLQDAERCCRRALEIQPDYVEALYLLGNTYKELGEYANAVSHYRRALKVNPQYGAAHCNLGAALEALGNFAAAADQYRQALQLEPQSAGLHYNLGNALRGQNLFQEAAECYRRATQLDPSYVEAYNNLGLVLGEQGQIDEAVECYQRALRLRPDYAEAHNNLGSLLEELGKLDEATVHYHRALEIQPDYAEAHNNLGVTLHRRGRPDEAVDCFRRALAGKPDYAEAYSNLGNALTELWRLDEAAVCHRRAIELASDNPQSWSNLGFMLTAQGKFQEGMDCFRRAIGLDPDNADAHFNLALTYLSTADFGKGWKEYPWHWKRSVETSRTIERSPWNESMGLDGQTVLLHPEQGLGDELFFLRFAPQLKARGARVAYASNPKIASMLSRVPTIDKLVSPQEPVRADLAFHIGDLPEMLGMRDIGRIPPPLLLTPLPEKLEQVRAKLAALGSGPYIGVTWRAGVRTRTLYKEAPLNRLAQTFKTIPATVLILQRQPLAGEIEAFAQALGRPAHDLSTLNEELEAMLALLALIDEYVGVSNTNMHLRAGVGKTAKVLVPAPPEWRWMAEGKESPWFPGFAVYRQGYDGSWKEAFDMLATDLRRAPDVDAKDALPSAT